MKRDLRELPVIPRRIGDAETIPTLINRFRRSGLSLQDFARAEGLPRGRLHYWVYQKRGQSAAAEQLKSPSPAAPVFQEIKLGGGLSLVPSWAAEVSLPAGVAVRFSSTAQPAWIGAVVQALHQPC